jgi:DNA-binding NtrC family response regulator
LTEAFLKRANEAAERSLTGVSADALEVLRTYRWPGNLDEFYEVLRAAVLRAKGQAIEAGDLPFYLRSKPAPVQKPLALDAVLEQVERRLIVNALRQAKNNKSRAAELLTIWRARLLRRMENLGIKDEEP